MVALSSPSLKRMIVSFSYLVSFGISVLHVIGADLCQLHGQLRFVVDSHFLSESAEKAGIPTLGTVRRQLDCQIEKQLLGLAVGGKDGNHVQTLHRCFTIGAAERIQGFLLKNGHGHRFVPP